MAKAKKHTKPKSISNAPLDNEKLLFAVLVAAVLITAAMIMFRSYRKPTMLRSQVNSDVLGSSSDLMEELKTTVDDGGASDIQELRNDSSGL